MSIGVGTIVSIALGGGMTSGGALCCAGVSFEIIGETPKAWKVQAETERGSEITAWLPKRALVKPVDRGTFGNQPVISAQLAKWYSPAGWTARFLELATRNSVLTAG